MCFLYKHIHWCESGSCKLIGQGGVQHFLLGSTHSLSADRKGLVGQITLGTSGRSVTVQYIETNSFLVLPFVCAFLFALQPSTCEEGCVANQTSHLLGVVSQDHGYPYDRGRLSPGDAWNFPRRLSFGRVGVLDPSPLRVDRSVRHP